MDAVEDSVLGGTSLKLPYQKSTNEKAGREWERAVARSSKPVSSEMPVTEHSQGLKAV